MGIWQRIRSSFSRSAQESTSVYLERQIVYIRWFGIVTALPAVLFIPMVQTQRIELLVVVLFTALYNTVLPWVARRDPERLGIISAACDAIASACFVWIAGFDSQLYLVLFSIVIASSMRFGMGFGIAVVGLFSGLDLASHVLAGHPDVALIGFKSCIMAVDAILCAVLFRYARQGDVLLQRTNEQLKQAIERLTELDAMKSSFISTASHELRTPLTAIRSFSEFLIDDSGLNPDAKEFARIINEESERLTRLVSDLLDLSRIESGNAQRRLETYDFGAQVRQVFTEQEPVALRKGLDFRLELYSELPPVAGDPDALHQVLLNLLSNAIKFTDHGAITLRAQAVPDGIAVAVEDTGVGISPEEQERVFERFYQAGNGLTDKPSGTGLGLAIAKEVLLQHGADLRVRSAPGAGSTFSFVLPAEPAQPPMAAAANSAELAESAA